MCLVVVGAAAAAVLPVAAHRASGRGQASLLEEVAADALHGGGLAGTHTRVPGDVGGGTAATSASPAARRGELVPCDGRAGMVGQRRAGVGVGDLECTCTGVRRAGPRAAG